MATPMPAEITIAASIQSRWKRSGRSFLSRALKKSRFQMLSQSAMPTLAPTSSARLPVSSQATSR